ncbi:uncharacterized protein TEOVI_000212800 [Trypanosoma equiperdum]|uniref:Uncharacterized protein n=1 Tax=Trypanosoma equiperdum TaxID=5694 RepID=A0A1G4IE62_TRYEQ|nr:hypothetical protein TEOVI_000212800 [Trypanosoma equiperdum]
MFSTVGELVLVRVSGLIAMDFVLLPVASLPVFPSSMQNLRVADACSVELLGFVASAVAVIFAGLIAVCFVTFRCFNSAIFVCRAWILWSVSLLLEQSSSSLASVCASAWQDRALLCVSVDVPSDGGACLPVAADLLAVRALCFRSSACFAVSVASAAVTVGSLLFMVVASAAARAVASPSKQA